MLHQHGLVRYGKLQRLRSGRRARRASLWRLALEEERVAQFEVAIDDYDKLPKMINEFVEMVEDLGPNPFKGF